MGGREGNPIERLAEMFGTKADRSGPALAVSNLVAEALAVAAALETGEAIEAVEADLSEPRIVPVDNAGTVIVEPRVEEARFELDPGVARLIVEAGEELARIAAEERVSGGDIVRAVLSGEELPGRTGAALRRLLPLRWARAAVYVAVARLDPGALVWLVSASFRHGRFTRALSGRIPA